MSRHLSLLLISLLLAACARTESSITELPTQESLPCSAYGGLSEQVCPASIYSIIASPYKYYGRVVAFRGFVHQSQSGTIAVYPSEDLALNGDEASSILCVSTEESCESYVGAFAEIFGSFSNTTNPDSLFKPVGTVALVHVRSFKPPHGR